MTQTFEAIYENGVIRPLSPVHLSERTRVRVVVEDRESHPLLQFCGTVPDEDAHEISKIIADEFEKVDPKEWN